MTASVDMFPQQLRKSGRRELLILTIAITCYLVGLLLVTEVRGRGHWMSSPAGTPAGRLVGPHSRTHLRSFALLVSGRKPTAS